MEPVSKASRVLFDCSGIDPTMVALQDYAGREQSYVKHVFLERYLEALIFKTASRYNHIVYVDGFAGPWQSASEQFDDTSFGIALNGLRRAKQTWKKSGRVVNMTALLVEQNAAAHAILATIPPKYPDIAIKTYSANFLSIVPLILRDIPSDAFAFFFIDPKGWRIPLASLQPLLARPKSEVTFNFMFDFINRAASMTEPATVAGLDELMPRGDWRARLAEAERGAQQSLTPEQRKNILIGAFTENLAQIGDYQYVVPTEILRPLMNRTLYCLFYATRHESGIAAFRECQTKALDAQAETRASLRVRHEAVESGQSEFFQSLHDMGPNETASMRAAEKVKAEALVIELTPKAPDYITYKKLWAAVLTKHAVRVTDLNTICANLRKEEVLLFLDWEPGKRVPQDHYRIQRPA
jgi:three-Cys-motif partner protein